MSKMKKKVAGAALIGILGVGTLQFGVLSQAQAGQCVSKEKSAAICSSSRAMRVQIDNLASAHGNMYVQFDQGQQIYARHGVATDGGGVRLLSDEEVRVTITEEVPGGDSRVLYNRTMAVPLNMNGLVSLEIGESPYGAGGITVFLLG